MTDSESLEYLAKVMPLNSLTPSLTIPLNSPEGVVVYVHES